MNEWRQILALVPGHVPARLALAAAHERTGDRVEALREYQRVLELDPDDPVAGRAFGRAAGSGRR